MRRVFNKKQLIVMWVVGLVICLFFILTPREGGKVIEVSLWEEARGLQGYRKINWNRAFIYPVIIIGGLLVVTFAKRQPPKERRE